MNRFFLWSLMVLCIVRSASGGEWCVIQENGSIPQSAWQSNSTEQKITILESMGEQVFVFHVVEFVDPCPQACEPQCTCQCMWDEDVQYEAADLNVLDSALNPADPGQEIHFEIRTARNVARIAVEPDNPMYADNVTTDIVHLDITGDFLETAAMTVDQVTGPIAVGGSVLNTFNINGDLATEIDIGVNVEWGVEVMVGHDLASTGTIHVHGDVRGSIGVNGSCDPAYGLRGSIIVDGNLAAQSKTDWGYIWVERDVHPGGLIHVGGAVEGDLDQGYGSRIETGGTVHAGASIRIDAECAGHILLSYDVLNNVAVAGNLCIGEDSAPAPLSGCIVANGEVPGEINVSGDVLESGSITLQESLTGVLSVGGSLRSRLTLGEGIWQPGLLEILGDVCDRARIFSQASKGRELDGTIHIHGNVDGYECPTPYYPVDLHSISNAGKIQVDGSVMGWGGIYVQEDMFGDILIGQDVTGPVQDPKQKICVEGGHMGGVIDIGGSTGPNKNLVAVKVLNCSGEIRVGGDCDAIVRVKGMTDGAIDVHGNVGGVVRSVQLSGTISIDGGIEEGGAVRTDDLRSGSIIEINADAAGDDNVVGVVRAVRMHPGAEIRLRSSGSEGGTLSGTMKIWHEMQEGASVLIEGNLDGLLYTGTLTTDELPQTQTDPLFRGHVEVLGDLNGSVAAYCGQEPWGDSGHLAGTITVHGDLNGTIIAEKEIQSTLETPPIVIEGSMGANASIEAREDTIANEGDDDEALVSLALGGVPYVVAATAPRMGPSGDPGPADASFEFDITVKEGPTAEIVIDNSVDHGSDEFDLGVRRTEPDTTFSLTTLTQKDDPGTYAAKLNNLLVDGDIDEGDWDEFAINLPDADVGGIRARDTLNSKIKVSSIQLLSYYDLNENLCIPYDGDTPPYGPHFCGPGTPAVVTTHPTTGYVKTQLFLFGIPGLYYWVHTTNDNGFDRWQWHDMEEPGLLGYYSGGHGDWWACAHGKVSDLDASGGVDLYDFETFARCFSGEGVTTRPQNCPDDDTFARPDFDWDGDVDLDDFAVFCWQLESEDEWDDAPEDCTPDYLEDPDVDLIETWVEGDLMDLGEGDPAWVEAINNVIDILHGYEDPDYEGLIGSLEDINFRPVSESSAFSTPEDTAKWFTFSLHYSDPDGDDLQPSIVTQPSHGEFRSQVWDLNGKLIKVEYLPDEGYTGPDSFTWKVTETDTAEEYESDPHATVTITVTEE